MNLVRFMARVTGAALITVAGASFLIKKLAPKPEDFVSSAVHFRKGMEEFQKGFASILFGSSQPSAEEIKKERESKRIQISEG